MPGPFDDLVPADPVLKQVKGHESYGGENLPPEANYAYPRSHASGLYQFEPATWKEATKATGLGKEYAEAYQAPPIVQTANAEWLKKTYGPNSSHAWAASAPPGGYREPRQVTGAFDDLIPKQKPQAAQGAFTDLIPKQGPPQRPPGPMDPSIAARQNMPAPAAPSPIAAAAAAPAQAMQNAPGASVAKWLGMKAAHGADWASKLPPDLVSNAIGNATGWAADKVEGTATEIFKRMGVSNPETQAHALTDFVLNAPMAMIGTGVSMPGRAMEAAREAPKADALGSSVEAPKEAPPNEASISARAEPQPAGAAATPIHEVLAQNIRAKEATMAAADPTWKDSMRAAANAIKSVTAPETVRDIGTGERTGEEAAATIRKNLGETQRETQQAAAALNQYYKMFNDVTPEEGLTVLRWLQKPETRGAGGYAPTPETEGFMKTFAGQMQKVQRALQSMDKTKDMEFKQNFVSQLWQNPDRVMGNLMGKQGSGYFTKKSVWDSYDEGIRQGGIPISTNPLEIGLRYVENANKFIASTKIVEDGVESGRIVFRNPAGGNIPKGWVPLKGRAENYGGTMNKAYAPPGYALVYNNYVSTLPQGAAGDFLSGLQKAANVTTMTKLGLSYFHAGLMMVESMGSGFANAIDNLAGGKALTALWKTAEAPIYPMTSLWRAKQAIDAYMDTSGTVGGVQVQKAVKALTAANFRMKGRGSVTDEYRASFLPDFFDSFKKGRLKLEAQQAGADIAAHPVLGPARQAANLVFRTLDTVSAPIFQYMVPRLKTGAALDMMQTYMRRKPLATDEELAAYARRVSNIIDDRFGEMNHDNIFLNKVQKSVMQSMLVSYSYEYGSARAGIGAGLDLSKILQKGWSPRMSYPVGLFMSMAVASNIYQYLMTGKAATSVQDIKNPQTGGTDPNSGQPGRAVLPSSLNQFFTLWNDPATGMSDKMNEMWRTVGGLVSMMGPTGGYDYKGDPLVDKNAPGIDQLAQAGYFAMQNFEPMFMQQSANPPPGSAIGPAQRFFGVRDAPHRAVDPEGSARGLRYVNAEKAITKKQHEGQLPRYLPSRDKKLLIQQEMNRYGGVQ